MEIEIRNVTRQVNIYFFKKVGHKTFDISSVNYDYISSLIFNLKIIVRKN